MYTRIGFGFMMLLSAACSGDSFSTAGDAGNGNDAGNVPPTGGGDPDSADVSAPPPGCDTTQFPTSNACVVNDAQGIFVSSSLGSASGDGTQAHPLASFDAALTLAKSTQRRVYACAETYAEQIHLQEGTNVFGYFTCSAGWVVGSAHASVKAPASPVASAVNIVAPTRVEAVDLVAPDYAAQSQSSIALIATGSPGLTITQATIHAGVGGNGDDGVAGIQLTDSGSAKNGGNTIADGAGLTPSFMWLADVRDTAPAAGTNVCTGATGYTPGSGGAGGYGGVVQSEQFVSWDWVADGQVATAGSPTTPTTQTAQGGALGGYAGSSGAAGANGTSGASGASFGALSAAGYTPSNGTAGSSGAVGQGGGGSGGYALTYLDYNPASYQGDLGWGEAGPSGGAGGCPGLAGGAGNGGGASIAVIAIQSPFTLDTVIIQSSAGGAGGSAGLGSVPTAGGTGGSPAVHTVGAGAGGAGGLSGVGGNGGGGPSLGIAYQGTQPQLLASTVTPGAGGSGVAVRTGTDGQVVPASLAGLSAASYAF